MKKALLAAAVLLLPSLLLAEGPSDPRRGFGLFARPLGAITINRVYCGLSNTGEFCLDSLNSSTIGGGYWPRGTRNQYIFNSGPVIAGIISADGGPWAGDTAGGFFFDAKGTTQHGLGVTEIYNASSPTDRSNWPDAARVPGAPLYHPLLHDSVSASEGDVWWLMWEGDTTRLAGRPHPLGIAAEVRVMGWNYPTGNEDIIYFMVTYYNITSTDPADYAAVRPSLRPHLFALASRFHAMNNAAFGITLPVGGYSISPMFSAIWNDMDVGSATQNYASTNIPLSLGYTYENTFSQFAGWQFDVGIFSPPFFAGTGFGGITYLEQANGVGRTHLFSGVTGGGGDLNDARDVNQLYRYLSATLSTAYGDGACNFNPVNQHICFIRQTSASDIRSWQSSGPFILGPGESQVLVTAYVFAAPVRTAGSVICPACDIKPGAATIIAGLDDPVIVAGGVNPIDSIAGFLGATDYSGDGVLQRDEFLSIPRSLYGKTQLAQAIFDNQFLLPSAPASPEFFLIPGDGRVTVIWRPSPTEQAGDPFYSVAKDAMRMNASGALVPNPLYDPNYRQFDVEGYRIYRGRTSDPSSMELLAQFDYAGTLIQDYGGQLQPTRLCAPELGILSQCPVAFDPVVPGQARVAHVDIPLVGPVIQVRFGDRVQLTDGSALVLQSDTIGANYQLADNGVPFAYEDNTVRNNFRYFYAVTAFDLNSLQSGPASFESPRILKSVTPVRPASNYQNTAATSLAVYGREARLLDNTMPTLDPVTGRFSKAMPPSNGWEIFLPAFIKELVPGPGAVTVRLDSLWLGDPYGPGNACAAPVPVHYFATILTEADTSSLIIPIVQDCFNNAAIASFEFTAIRADPALASRYGGTGAFTFDAQLVTTLEGNYYTNSFGRGCVNGAPGFAFANTPQTGCDYNGARWFDGPSPQTNETRDHPNACSSQNFTNTNTVTCFSNAGALTGVANVFEAKAYQTTPNIWRDIEGALGGAVRGADYNVYWGSAGQIDSVIDITHNVIVPFDSNRIGASWGILNTGNTSIFGVGVNYDERAEVTISDFGCVEPLRSFASVQARIPCPGTSYTLSDVAVPGPMAFFTGPITANRTMPAAPGPGFVMYLAGHIFAFEFAPGLGVPSPGTVWSMRDYIGAIRGGGNGCALCQAGADGLYAFLPRFRTMAAVGAEIRFSYDVVNQVNAPVTSDLSAVHTVPDPYYLSNAFEADAGAQTIKFVNLPQDAVIRIYSSSGVLVTLLEHHSTTFGGAADWNVRNRTGKRVSSGVYFYHLEAGNARRVGRFTIVNDRPGF